MCFNRRAARVAACGPFLGEVCVAFRLVFDRWTRGVIAESSRSRRGVVAESVPGRLFFVGQNGGVAVESSRSRSSPRHGGSRSGLVFNRWEWRSRRGVGAESSRSHRGAAARKPIFCGQDLCTTMPTQVTTTNTPICATILHVFVVVVVVVAPHGAARVGIHNPLSGHLFVMGLKSVWKFLFMAVITSVSHRSFSSGHKLSSRG